MSVGRQGHGLVAFRGPGCGDVNRARTRAAEMGSRRRAAQAIGQTRSRFRRATTRSSKKASGSTPAWRLRSWRLQLSEPAIHLLPCRFFRSVASHGFFSRKRRIRRGRGKVRILTLACVHPVRSATSFTLHPSPSIKSRIKRSAGVSRASIRSGRWPPRGRGMVRRVPEREEEPCGGAPRRGGRSSTVNKCA